LNTETKYELKKKNTFQSLLTSAHLATPRDLSPYVEEQPAQDLNPECKPRMYAAMIQWIELSSGESRRRGRGGMKNRVHRKATSWSRKTVHRVGPSF
jgi:hypothetical protein